MKVTVIQIVIGAFGTVSKGLVKGLEDLEIKRHRPKYIDESWGHEETCCHSNSSGKRSTIADVKTLREVIIIRFFMMSKFKIQNL